MSSFRTDASRQPRAVNSRARASCGPGDAGVSGSEERLTAGGCRPNRGPHGASAGKSKAVSGVNKALFDELHVQASAWEVRVGCPLSWERLDDKRASRVAAYHSVGASRTRA